MRIHYIDKDLYKKTPGTIGTGLHIVVGVDKEQIQKFLLKHRIDSKPDAVLGNITIINNNPTVIVLISLKTWFLDIKNACDSLKDHLVSKSLVNAYIHTDALPSRLKRAFLLTLFKSIFRFRKYISDSSKAKQRTFYLVDYKRNEKTLADIIYHVQVGDLSRALATEPANTLYPEKFCDIVRSRFKDSKDIQVRIMNMQDMRNLDLNLIVSVGKGALHEPKFIILEYLPNKNGESICIIGKGVVFDSGGYNLKSGDGMTSMKGDKTGGAVVVGIFEYLRLLDKKPNVNIVGLIPLVENLISHSATKPGDIVKTYGGKTVEIIDTDAEGRLIMADALAYACDKYRPKYVLDFATLTGWSGLMHCDTSYVYYTMNDELAHVVEHIGDHVGERSVRMPKWPEYTQYTKGTVSDYKNLDFGCKRSGGFMAAMFLMNFIVPELRDKWIHFDITHSSHGSLHNCNSLATGIDIVFKYFANT